MEPPVAARRPVTTTHHGIERTDDYAWLAERDDPEVVAYQEAENAYHDARTAHLADLRQTLFDEIKARTRETDLSVPVRNRGWWWYSRSFEGKEYGASCRVRVEDEDDWTPPRPAEDAAPDQPALPGEEVLLDLNELAAGHDFFSLGGSSVSLDGRLLAYSVDITGDERYTVRFKVLETGELLNDELTGVLGGVTWSPDGSCYYTTVDESWRADKVWRHVLGTPQSDDSLVFAEPDARFWVGVGRTRTDAFLVIAAGSKTTSEYRFLDLAADEPAWQVFAARREGVEYSLQHARIGGEDCFLVLHNAHGPDFELGRAPVAPTPVEGWAPVIPHDPAVRLEDVDAFAGHLVVHQRSEGLTQLRILELDAAGIADDYLVHFDDPLYTIGSGGNPAFDQPTVRIGYTTMATPSSIHDYDVRTRTLTELRRTPVQAAPDGRPFGSGDYEEHRLWATAPDGERVPLSLVVRRDRSPEVTGRPVPVLLYGYGAYEASIDPYFSIARLSLLDRGAAFAIAHVRGGGELGRRWYDDGKLHHKVNTFTDFVACGRHLVETGWTTPETLVAEGGSAGGLLIGAVANLAPELFGGLVAQVPFVDPLTTMLDASLPLTVTEYDEWGDPEHDPAAYADIAAYAPYDNVAARDYPPILAETSAHDTRVLAAEPAKWVARLRAEAVGRRDVLLRTELAAGHGGVSGRYQAWHDRARTAAWILDRMGLAEAVPGPNPRVP